MMSYKIIIWIVSVLFFLFALLWIFKTTTESDYEVLDQNNIKISNFPDYDKDQKLKNLFAEIQNDGIKFRNIYSTSNRFVPTDYTDDYWVVTTGVASLDEGIKYFFIPTYTRILIVDRKKRKVVINELFYKNITNAVLKDDYVYFTYVGNNNYKLGRFEVDLD